MQLTDSNECSVDKRSSRAHQEGIEEMPAETVGLAAVGKWLIGLVLAPWLWYERKRVDKIIEVLRDKHYTKEEVKEKIEDKLAPMQRDISWIREYLERD